MITLYKHQQDFLSQNPNKSALVWSCGTGKTRTAIEWAKISNEYTLIICPKALQKNWQRECKKWGLENWCVATKEEFRRDWNKEGFTGLGSARQVIVDEVHNGFLTPMFKSAMSKALRAYLKKHNVPRVLLLSATVYSSSPWNIYSLATLLGYNWNYIKFRDVFFDQVRMGMRWIPVAKKNIDSKLAGLVSKIASIVDIKDVMDVPLQNHLDPEYFALSLTQIKAIKDNYDPLPIVRYTAQHSIENGILNGNEFREPQLFECDKELRIFSLVQENKKVAIVCRYNSQIDRIKLLLEQNTELRTNYFNNIFVIRGDVKNRDSVTLEAEKADRCVVLIQADCAEGYQLPSFELCIFASMSYSYVKWEQICGRFLRMDKPSRTTFMYLLTEGDSIDQAVFNSVKRKENFQIELYAKK